VLATISARHAAHRRIADAVTETGRHYR